MREINKKSTLIQSFAKKLPAAALLASSVAIAAEPVQLKEVQVIADKAQKDPDSSANSYTAPTTKVGKFKQDPRDVPQALTTITRNLLNDQDANALRDALRNAPGITFNASEGGNSGDGIMIRGFSASNDIYLDNFRDAAQYNRDTFAVDRLEVLRGSASMLFGRGSTGGVVSQVSKTPYNADGGEVKLSAGTHDYYRGEVDLNKVVGQNEALRLTVMKQEAGSYREGAEQNRQGAQLALKTGIGEQTEVTYSFLHYRENNVPDYGVPFFGNTPLTVTDQFFGYNKADSENNENNVGTVEIIHKLDGGGTLRNATRIGSYTADLRATAPGLARGTTVINDSTGLTGSRKLRWRDQEIYANQTDYQNRFDTGSLRHQIQTGVELMREKLETHGRSQSCSYPSSTIGSQNPYANISCGALTDTSIANMKADTLGVYLNDLISLNPQWKVLLGARWDLFKTDSTSVNLNTGAVTPREREDRIWSWRSGLIYQPTSKQSYHFSYGTSFNPSAESYSIDALGENTPPEKNRNIEVGAKWELLDGDLNVNTTVFRSEKTNERQTDIADNPTQYLLSGRRHTDGVELELAGRVTEKWQVFAGYARFRARIDESAPGINNVGKVPPNTPDFTANLWTTYEMIPGLKGGFGVYGLGKRYAERTTSSTLTNSRYLPAFYRWDASLEWQHRQYSVQLNVYNLFDKAYYEGMYPAFATPGMARSARVTLGYQF